MTAEVEGSDIGDAWADGDDWALELAHAGERACEFDAGQLWPRIAEGKRRD